MYFCVIGFWLFFFFFKQKTAYEMRISDWSSDVCSSDLGGFVDMGSVCRVEDVDDPRLFLETLLAAVADLVKTCRQFLRGNAADVEEIGRASCRERVCQYV